MFTIKIKLRHVLLLSVVYSILLSNSSAQIPTAEPDNYRMYPEVNSSQPDLPSPFLNDEKEFVVALTQEQKYAIIDVTLSNSRGICTQLFIDTLDFPDLVKTGLHDDEKLMHTSTITGWPVDSISLMGQPGGLSKSGFMDVGEDIISVMLTDNRTISKMGLTHPQMAKPLFHVLNMMDHDLNLNRWNMAKHEWQNIQSFFYNGRGVHVIAYDTKGGQRSIFNDGIGGAFHIKIWRDPDELEMKYLKNRYRHLQEDEFEQFVKSLSFINIGEMQPQYIMRYGFYEGHTFWRAEPLAISFIFGLLPLEDLDKIFEHRLDKMLANNAVQ